MRWDVRYWTDGQVDALLAKVSARAFAEARGDGNQLTAKEMNLLERLTFAVADTGGEWLDRRRGQVTGSAFRPFLMVRALNLSDSRVEDAVGQLAADDLDSAVLSARAAFDYSVDALIAFHGDHGHGEKWRARRFRSVSSPTLSFDDYWRTTTMRGYDPRDPAGWVRQVLTVCQRIAMEVSI
jgi:hypothetical protein